MFVLTLTVLTVSGCKTPSADSFCLTYNPIKYKVEQVPDYVSVSIDKNNAKYLERCM